MISLHELMWTVRRRRMSGRPLKSLYNSDETEKRRWQGPGEVVVAAYSALLLKEIR